LIEAGAPVDARESESESTALHHASSWGRLLVVEALVSRGAEVNAVNRSGATPLDAAAANGHEQVVAFLRARGGAARTPAKAPVPRVR
jgi:uncharacterized protein